MSLDFVAIDFETANSSRSSACAIGLVDVRDGEIFKTYSRVFRPPIGFDEFNGWNIAIHGITPSMVAKEPRFADLWPEISQFIGDRPVVAHNASFDLSVLRSTLSASDLGWPTLSYACTMVMSRAVFDLTSHGLSFVAHKVGIEWDEELHHEALYDAKACASIAIAISRLKEETDLPTLLDSLGLSMGRLRSDGWDTCRLTNVRADNSVHSASNISASDVYINVDADKFHPLYGKEIVFTGALYSMSRPDAWFEVAKIGAIPSGNVTKHTNVIVVGQQDPSKFKAGQMVSEKFRKAEKLKAAGQDIEVFSEADFLAYIEPMSGSAE